MENISNPKEHWNKVYGSNKVTQLGWYEESPEKSLELIEKCGICKDEKILDVGVGASTLIDNLVERGYSNIIVADISEEALKKLKMRLGTKASSVDFIVDDITQPKNLIGMRDVSIWHDRAVLHFLTKENERRIYLSTLSQVVKADGYVIVEAFSLEGASKCSGLDVRRYSVDMLQEFLGDEFRLIENFDYLYHMPSGDTRPYICTLFKRIKGGE